MAEAEVTRGALYHHFADKTALFMAVAQQMAQEVAQAIDTATSGSGPALATPLHALLLGADAYFDAMADEGRAQLLLRDAPAVLSGELLAQLSQLAGQTELEEGLQALVQQAGGAAAAQPVDAREVHALAQLLSAAFDRTALALAQQQDIGAHRAALRRLLLGLEAVCGQGAASPALQAERRIT